MKTIQTPETPWYYYPDVLERFRKDTEGHEMDVRHDDGIYRHIVFSQPEHRWLYWYELITTPGQLTIRGDMGCYVFARVTDMFHFFDGPHINPGYWGEKLQAHSGYQEYSEDLARKLIREHFDDRSVDLDDGGSVWRALESEVLDAETIAAEDTLRAALDSFRHPSGYEFADVWEMDFRDYTVHYLWCCHAIQQGIKRYRSQP